MKYHHLNFEERFCIEKMYCGGSEIRRIAEFLGRSPNTVSRELKQNRVNGIYVAEKAKHKAYALRWRAKEGDDMEQIKKITTELSNELSKIGEILSKASEQASPSPAPEGSQDGQVRDADFEEKK